MKAYFVNAKTNECGPVDIDAARETYHKLLDCDCVDIVARYVGRFPFYIVVDGEGLLKPNRVGGVALDNDEILAGNILLFGISSDRTDFRDLTEQELEVIDNNVVGVLFEDFTIGCVLTYTIG